MSYSMHQHEIYLVSSDGTLKRSFSLPNKEAYDQKIKELQEAGARVVTRDDFVAKLSM